MNGTGKDLHDAIGDMNLSRWLAFSHHTQFLQQQSWRWLKWLKYTITLQWRLFFFAWPNIQAPPPTHHQFTICKKKSGENAPVNLKTSRNFPGSMGTSSSLSFDKKAALRWVTSQRELATLVPLIIYLRCLGGRGGCPKNPPHPRKNHGWTKTSKKR